MPAPIDPLQARFRKIAAVKAVLAVVTLVIMLFTFRYPLPLIVAGADLMLIPVWIVVARRYPAAAAYGLLIQTVLAFTPRQFVQGYVNGVNWVLYLPIPLAAGWLLGSRAALIRATILTGAIALPIMLTAALMLPPLVTRAEILTLIGYLLVVLWALAWLGGLYTRRTVDETNE